MFWFFLNKSSRNTTPKFVSLLQSRQGTPFLRQVSPKGPSNIKHLIPFTGWENKGSGIVILHPAFDFYRVGACNSAGRGYADLLDKLVLKGNLSVCDRPNFDHVVVLGIFRNQVSALITNVQKKGQTVLFCYSKMFPLPEDFC